MFLENNNIIMAHVEYGLKTYLKTVGLFGLCFFFFFLRTVFKNIGNTILVFFKNYYCFLNLVFFVFFMFFRT